MNIRVLVADEREANFFDAPGIREPLALCGSIVNDAAGLKDRELETDRSGTRGNQGSPGRHGVDGERSTVKHQIELFARDVARAVDEARVKHEFDRLVIVAGPRMLGLLRNALPSTCRAMVAAEIPKDLVQHEPAAIRAAVPHSAFFH